jgi:EpsD family peptidyl-prolyl cis-trans isomerase
MRMKSSFFVAAACLALAACGQGDKAPTGQVVATVKGKEITLIDLRNELNGFTSPDAKTRKAAEQAALDAIVNRKLLAAAAEDAKIDKSPEFAQQQKRLNETLLVQTWQAQIAKQVPPPGADEVAAFIEKHPEMYAARKIYGIDQIRMARPADGALLTELQPLSTLEQVRGLLTAKGLKFVEGTDQMDTLTANPKMVEAVTKLPDGEVFIIPAGNMLLINRIREARVEPVTGPDATKHAKLYLTNQRTQEAVSRQFSTVIAGAKKDVSYSKAYQPKAPAAPAKPAKPVAS